MSQAAVGQRSAHRPQWTQTSSSLTMTRPVCGSPPDTKISCVRLVAGAVSRLRSSASSPLPDGGIDLRAAVEHYENRLIAQALERTGRNKNRAAQLLGLNRTTLVEMLKRKGL